MKAKEEYLDLYTRTVFGTKIKLLAIIGEYDNLNRVVDFLVVVYPNGYTTPVKSNDIIKPKIEDEAISKFLENVKFSDKTE